MIQNLILGILFWKYFGHTTFLYFSRRSGGLHQSFFFKSRFSGRKSQSQQKLAKKITHFTIQFRSKSVTHFTNLNSLDISPATQPEIFLTSHFPAIMFLFGVKKTLHCTISWRSGTEFLKNFESKCLHISKYLLMTIFVSET